MTSSRGRASGRLSAITKGATASTAIATTTLTKNAQRQLSTSVSSPPSTAPVVNPAAISAPLSPSARSRSGPSANVVVSSDSAAGMTAAVASPWPARAASSSAGESARPPTSEETPSSAIPSRNSRRRPNRSAIRPNSSVKPAAQSANDVAIHCRCERPRPTSAPITGSATLRIEKSTARVKLAASRTASARR